MSALCQPRRHTRPVYVGNVCVGGDAPVVVQTMCNTPTEDVDATLAQIERVASVGSELIRVTVPSAKHVEAFTRIVKASPIPVIADIHFDHKLALAAIDAGASAVRINPGNIGGEGPAHTVFAKAREADVPVRIGVNAGSLAKSVQEDTSLSQVDKLVQSARIYYQVAQDAGLNNVVFSVKSHGVEETIDANTKLAEALSNVPLHLGVTEAGDAVQGTVKNSVALANLLQKGIGDTIRISLTAKLELEVEAGYALLKALGLREQGIEYVTCPTCGRCQVDLISIAQVAKQRLAHIKKPLTVALMGCSVNGPGEAKQADAGVAFQTTSCVLFKRGHVVKTCNADSALDELEHLLEEW